MKPKNGRLIECTLFYFRNSEKGGTEYHPWNGNCIRCFDLISFIISLFRFIRNLRRKIKKNKTAEPQRPAPTPAAAPVVEDVTDDTELVAVMQPQSQRQRKPHRRICS